MAYLAKYEVPEAKARHATTARGGASPQNARSVSAVNGKAGLTPGERARRYLLKYPPAISGQRGHDHTFRAACVLIKGFGLTPDEALPLLLEWNERCLPEWTEGELRHKLADAAKQPGPDGYLLGEDLPESTTPARVARDGWERPHSKPRAFRNYRLDEQQTGDTLRQVKVGLPIQSLASDVYRLGGEWPIRVGANLVVEQSGKPVILKDAAALTSWIKEQLPAGERNAMAWAKGEDMVTPAELFSHLKRNAPVFDGVEEYPHEPPIPGLRYLHPTVEPGDGSALREFLELFCPSTTEDHSLLLAFLLTLVWGGRAGRRPAWLFVADDGDSHKGRGAGKTTAVQKAAELVGGYLMFTPRDAPKDVKVRMLSPEGLTRRVALFDNVKSCRLSSSTIEADITSARISGHQMYEGEAQRVNHLNFVFTFNAPAVSKDLAERCVIVRLARPVYSADWHRRMDEMLDCRRWEIIGDLIAALRRPTQPIARPTRWADFDAEIIGRLPDPERVLQVIRERRQDVDDEEKEAAIVRESFMTALRHKGHDPESAVVWVPVRQAAQIYCEAVGERLATNKATAALCLLPIPEIRRSNRGCGRGVVWFGTNADQDASSVPFDVIQE